MNKCFTMAALLTVFAVSAAPLPATASPAPLLPYQSPDKTIGTVNCANSMCHGAITNWKDSRVLQNEYVTWSRLDKHTRATAVLNNERSARIAHNLGLKEPASQAAICLDCHAHNVPEQLRGERFVMSDGIACEACHGPAERWVRTHVVAGANHADNIAHGLYPVDQPIARARLCLSCHFGNADKLVTHRLMGAGHPRLSFELETFSMVEPAHFRQKEPDHGEALRWDGVKIWAVGQALAVSQSMSILLDPKRGHDGIFPELVLFDCHACHHPMSETRWKPHSEFGPGQAPGVVRLNDANLLMLLVLARQINHDLGERVRIAAARLQAASAGSGDLASEARQMRDLAETLARGIDELQFTPAMMRGLALGLVDEGLSGDYSDYSGAEQAFMSISSVVDFLNRQKSLAAGAEVGADLNRLALLLRDDEHFKPAEFQAQLRTLRVALARG